MNPSAARPLRARTVEPPLFLEQEPSAPPTPERGGWLRRSRPGIISLVLHLLALGALALFSVHTPSRNYGELLTIEADPDASHDLFDDPDGGGDRSMEIRPVLAASNKDDAPLRSSLSKEDSPELGASLAAGSSRPTEDGAKDGGKTEGSGGKQSEGLGEGGGAGAAGAGVGNIPFGGLKAKGRRFVYLIDRSASMNEHGAIEFAKEELVKSIRALQPTMEFQVIFYNDEAESLPIVDRRKDLIPASDANRERAVKRIMGYEATGGTDHGKALEKAFTFRPDVIFVLTDAEDTDAEIRRLIQRVTALNQRRKGTQESASIHVIQFWHEKNRPPITIIQELAKKNKGTFRVVIATE